MVNPLLISALISGGASLAGAGINAGTSIFNRNQDMEMLKYQNEYNSPKAQLQRALEAGLNPNAVAQSLAGASSFGNMAAADASNLSKLPEDLGSQIGNSVNNALQASLIRANIANVKEDTKGKKIENDYGEATFDARVDQAINEGVITKSEAEKARLTAERYPELLDLSVEQAKAQLDKTREERNKILKDIEVSDQKIEESKKNIDKMEQEIRTGKSQETKNYADAALTRERTKLSQLEQENQELKNRNLEISGEESGWRAQYWSIADKEGKERADAWLEENVGAVEKVVKNTSKASAEGSQEVYDNTPQGQTKKMYYEQMNKELSKVDNDIKNLRTRLKSTADKRMYDYYQRSISDLEKKKNDIRDKYSKKIANVDKGMHQTYGASVAGFGVNYSN